MSTNRLAVRLMCGSICCLVIEICIVVVFYLCNSTLIAGGGRLKTIRVVLPSSGTVHVQYVILLTLKKYIDNSRIIPLTPVYPYYTILFNEVNEIDF